MYCLTNGDKMNGAGLIIQGEFEKIKSNAIVYDLLDDLAPVERGQENDAYRLTYDQCSA